MKDIINLRINTNFTKEVLYCLWGPHGHINNNIFIFNTKYGFGQKYWYGFGQKYWYGWGYNTGCGVGFGFENGNGESRVK